MALSDRAEHESSRELLRQFADGKIVQEPEIGMGPKYGLHDGTESTSGHQSLFDAPVQLDTTTSVQ